jgi:hypothetical protein
MVYVNNHIPSFPNDLDDLKLQICEASAPVDQET